MFLPRSLGEVADANAGIIAGAAAGAAVGWRRRRELPFSDSGVNELPCKLLCQAFAATDRDQDGRLSPEELGLVPVPSAQFLGLLDLDDNTFFEPSDLREYRERLLRAAMEESLCTNAGACPSLLQKVFANGSCLASFERASKII